MPRGVKWNSEAERLAALDLAQQRYRASANGREVIKRKNARYRVTAAGKMRLREGQGKYDRSDKGKATKRKYIRRRTLRKASPQMQRERYRVIAELVPQGVVGRDDVIAEMLLAVAMGTETLASLRKAGRGKYATKMRRENYEGRGYAVSLDVPIGGEGGQSWHDVLPAADVEIEEEAYS